MKALVILSFATVGGTAAAQPLPSDAAAPPAPTAPGPSPDGTAPIDSGDPTIQEFDTEPPAPPSSGTPAGDPDAKVQPTNDASPDVSPDATMDEFIIRGRGARVGLNFFGDLSFVTTSEQPHTNFVQGPLGLIISGDLSPQASALGEVVLENLPSGLVVDLERLLLRYKAGAWQFAAGRDHTNFGAWNTAYHHGTWLQPTIARPRALRFEDDFGVLPVHWIGAYATYTKPLHGGSLIVSGAIGNGRGEIVDDLLTGGDIDDGKALMIRLEAADLGAPHLRFGLSVIGESLVAQPAAIRPALPDQRITEFVTTGFVSYHGPTVTLMTEAHLVTHLADGDRWMTVDGFLFGGYTIDRFMPYAMIEVRRSSGGADPFFVPDPAEAGPPDLVEVIAGLRYDLSTWSAFKFEAAVFKAKAADAVTTGTINWAFGL